MAASARLLFWLMVAQLTAKVEPLQKLGVIKEG